MTPTRTRTGVPWAALLMLGLFAADTRGVIDLTDVAHRGGVVLAAMVQTPVASHRPHRRRPSAAAAPSRTARASIPPTYRRLYREAGTDRDGRPEVWCTRAGQCYPAWAVLASIGLVESSHGRSSAPGVRSGVNAFGCCAGPMQFNLRNGPPSTWDTWGRGNVYDPADAIPAAARKLRGDGARRDLDGALLAYNASWSYVNGVKAQARRYQRGT